MGRVGRYQLCGCQEAETVEPKLDIFKDAEQSKYIIIFKVNLNLDGPFDKMVHLISRYRFVGYALGIRTYRRRSEAEREQKRNEPLRKLRENLFSSCRKRAVTPFVVFCDLKRRHSSIFGAFVGFEEEKFRRRRFSLRGR